AIGNVIWEDTAEQIIIVSHYAEYKDSLSYILATGDPMLIDINDDDTMYMSADTLVTFKLPRFYAEMADTLMESDTTALDSSLIIDTISQEIIATTDTTKLDAALSIIDLDTLV